MDASKRRFCTLTLALSGLALGRAGSAAPAAKERVIKVEAKKFKYTPDRIEVKQAEAVVLEFNAIDFTHGFSVPDMKLRSDLVPGKVVRVRLATEAAGEFAFLCDNFCGSGHEEMSGMIVVKA